MRGRVQQYLLLLQHRPMLLHLLLHLRELPGLLLEQLEQQQLLELLLCHLALEHQRRAQGQHPWGTRAQDLGFRV